MTLLKECNKIIQVKHKMCSMNVSCYYYFYLPGIAYRGERRGPFSVLDHTLTGGGRKTSAISHGLIEATMQVSAGADGGSREGLAHTGAQRRDGGF